MTKKLSLLFLSCLVLFMPSTAFGEGWGYKKSDNNQPPDVGRYGPMVEKYDGFYVDPAGDKTVYLTFDNGYEQGYTGQVLDILKEKEVPATFFVTGHYIESAPDLLKRMAKEGHLIGNHSWSHPDFTTISKEKMKEELERVNESVQELTGQETMSFVRPPRGTFNDQTMKWASEFGYTHAFWSVAFKDWETDKQKGWEYAYHSVLDQIHPGAVVLLHTVSKDNAEALSQLIDELRKRGYHFGSLNDLVVKRYIPAPIWGM
ncbi:delta-lactam-biosynthetic de-N-acetylase [Halobacillus locisalis]|uniref:Delta-lactam-biosynthetic de-N-acetylase n=1 Tax=Halobacillus locisalis TaxID=220753 RepID=A0A838CWW9_9BACI|nr:delta-lactam-biosynthetic de-N-acetylase [Halobacillus locisalis]MBA2176460.1 delta-lactam-biosynthetic de-N-acetylase [Halobacillus locisalis]